MKNSKKMLSLVALLLIFTLALTACSSKPQDDSKDDEKVELDEKKDGEEKDVSENKEPRLVKIGIRSSGIDMVESFRADALEAGFEIETTVFDDAVQPNVAVDEGSVDLNFFQHEQYMLAFNETEGTSLTMLKPTVYYGIFGMFSDKHDSYENLPEGAMLTISNDPSNQDRALRMLNELELIKVDTSAELLTIHDIEENPKKLEFTTANNSLIPQTLPDVDAIVCSSTHLKNAGLNPEDSLIETSTDGDEYRIGFVVDESNKDEEWLKDFVDAALSEDLYKYITERGTDVPMFSYDDSGKREILPEALE